MRLCFSRLPLKLNEFRTLTVSPELIDDMVAAHSTAMRPMEQVYGPAGVGSMDVNGKRYEFSSMHSLGGIP